MLCPAPLNDKVPLLLILQRIYSRSPTCSTIIVVERFSERLDIIDFLTKQEDEENNNEFKRLLDEKYIRIFTRDFINSGRWNSPSFLGILYNPTNFDLSYRLWLDGCKFKLVIINKILENQEDRVYAGRFRTYPETQHQTLSVPTELTWRNSIPDTWKWPLSGPRIPTANAAR